MCLLVTCCCLSLAVGVAACLSLAVACHLLLLVTCCSVWLLACVVSCKCFTQSQLTTNCFANASFQQPPNLALWQKIACGSAKFRDHVHPRSAQTHTTLNKPACCALHNWAGVVVRCVACSCILFIFQTTNTTSITQTTASTTHLTTLLLSLSSAPILPANTEWLSNPWRTCSVQSN